MKPFDLEKALAGEPVVTRDGREVTQIHLFEAVKSDYHIAGVIDGYIGLFTKNGSYSHRGDKNDEDLFMTPKKRTVWVNLYGVMASGYNRGFFYDTEELANNAAGAGRICDKAYPIEIEE